MKKKGFTLIEMMAVIAILGILVIMVVPNVLKSYRDSKKVAFIDEAKVVYAKATDAYVLGKTKGQKITYISNEVEDTTQLDLKAKEDLKYTVQLDRKTGKVTSFVLKNTEFCIVGIGDFLNDYTKEQVIDYKDTGSGVNQTAIDLCNSETYRPGTPLEVELVDKINDRVKTKAKPNNLILKYNQGWYEKGTERSLSNGVGEDAIYKIDEIPTKINYYYKGSEVEGNDIKVIGCDGKIVSDLTGKDPNGKFLFLGKTNVQKAASQWMLKYYKVSFTGGDGRINTITVNYGEQKNLPTNKDTNGYGKNIKKTGYKFKGWLFNDDVLFNDGDPLPVLTDENEDQVVNGIDHKLFKFDNAKICSGEKSIDNIKSFVAQWIPIKYTVKYDPNGGNGTMAPTTDTYDSNETFRENTFTRTGYDFLGWSLDKNKTTADYTDKSNIPNLASLEGTEVTVYAIWSPKSYTVTLDVNSGNAWTSTTCKNPLIFNSSNNKCSKQVVYASEYGTLSQATKKGNKFEGWYKEKAGTNKVNTSTIVNTDNNHTVYAKWTPCGPGKYLKNNECVNCPENTYSTGTANDKCTDCKVGYYSSEGANSCSAIKYTITIKPNGGKYGSSTDNQSLEGTFDKVVTINNPTRDGYTFAGWTITDYDNNTALMGSANNKVNNAITDKTKNKYFKNLRSTSGTVVFTANWTANTYTITIKPNGGKYDSSTDNQSLEGTFDKVVTINNPTRNGYTFAGWTITDYDKNTALMGSANNKVNTAITDKTKNKFFKNLRSTSGTVVFTANWTANTYTITIKPNGGKYDSSTDNQSLEGTFDKVVTINNPTRNGYTFAGWTITDYDSNTALMGSVNNKVNTAITDKTKNKYFKNLRSTSGTVIFTANWTANTYTIAVQPNGGNYNNSTSDQSINASFDSVVNIANPKRDGYIFSGWTISGHDTSTAVMGTSNSNVTTALSGTPKETYYKNLRKTSGTVTFKANWENQCFKFKYSGSFRASGDDTVYAAGTYTNKWYTIKGSNCKNWKIYFLSDGNFIPYNDVFIQAFLVGGGAGTADEQDWTYGHLACNGGGGFHKNANYFVEKDNKYSIEIGKAGSNGDARGSGGGGNTTAFENSVNGGEGCHSWNPTFGFGIISTGEQTGEFETSGSEYSGRRSDKKDNTGRTASSGIVVIRNVQLGAFGFYTGKFKIDGDNKVYENDFINISSKNWKISFLTSGKLTLKDSVNADAFLVGGGGAGATDYESAGGAGGGGYTKTIKDFTIPNMKSLSIVVGEGGKAYKTWVDASGTGTESGGDRKGKDGGQTLAFGHIANGGKGGYSGAGGSAAYAQYGASSGNTKGQGYTTCEFEESKSGDRTDLTGCAPGVAAYSGGGIAGYGGPMAGGGCACAGGYCTSGKENTGGAGCGYYSACFHLGGGYLDPGWHCTNPSDGGSGIVIIRNKRKN